MGSITPYESAKGRRYRYRKPDRTEAEKPASQRCAKQKLYLSMVTVTKSKGEYIDPSSSRVPVRMFADSWLRSKQPPMSKPSYYMTLERAWKNHVAPVWAEREISSIRRSEVQDWGRTSRRRSRARLSSDRSGSLPASSTWPSTIVVSPAIRLGMCATFRGTGRGNVAYT